jgi:hypothetical protein
MKKLSWPWSKQQPVSTLKIPSINELHQYYYDQIDQATSAIQQTAEIGESEGNVLRPRFNQLVISLAPHRKRYVDYMLEQIRTASTPLAKERIYVALVNWWDRQLLRDNQLVEVSKLLNKSGPTPSQIETVPVPTEEDLREYRRRLERNRRLRKKLVDEKLYKQSNVLQTIILSKLIK